MYAQIKSENRIRFRTKEIDVSAPQHPTSEWTRKQAIFHVRTLSMSVAGEMVGGVEELEQDTLSALRALGVTDSELAEESRWSGRQ